MRHPDPDLDFDDARTTGEARYEGGIKHADYCNFVNFKF
jgi:hypothetical protein